MARVLLLAFSSVGFRIQNNGRQVMTKMALHIICHQHRCEKLDELFGLKTYIRAINDIIFVLVGIHVTTDRVAYAIEIQHTNFGLK